MVEKSLTPERVLEILNEDSSYCIPPLLAPANKDRKLSKHPTLLPGEKILLQQDVFCVETFNSLVEGTLHLTTFRVIFSGFFQETDDDSNCGHNGGRRLLNRLSFSKKKSLTDTLDRFRGKAQHLQKNLNPSKSSLTLKSSGKKKSDHDLHQTYSNHVSLAKEGSCTLLSVQQVEAKEAEKIKKELVKENVIVSIPCTNVYDVQRLSKNSLTKDTRSLKLADGIVLLCSTLQVYKFCLPLDSDYNAEKLTGIFSKYTKHLSPSKWFAIAYKEAIFSVGLLNIIDSATSSNFYTFEVEFERLGLLRQESWRVYSPNGHLERRVPKKSLIPHGISDVEMTNVVTFHGDKSFPTLCWRNQVDGTVMLRSGSALHRRGIFESRCEADENFLAFVCCQNRRSSRIKLVVFTEQSRGSSPSLLTSPQPFSGQITPKQGEAFCYPHVKFVYTEKESIPDHKVVEQSSYKLQALLAADCDDKTFLSALAETQWLSQISELLETTSLIITAMSTDKLSVLISYQDGYDRTAQLSSLAQLLLDPHYRTIDGFQVLIQKEWLSFGHMFAERCISPKSSEGHGPIFLQWLDCVWQLSNQFPFSFEFNEEFLQTIADHVYSCRFGTFLCDSELQYEEEQIASKTLSLWTWINLSIMAKPEVFLNTKYRKEKIDKILLPRYHIPSLKVWESYYAKTRLERNLEKAKHYAGEQRKLLDDICAGLINKNVDLRKKISNIQDDQSDLESSIESDISSMITSETKEELVSDVVEKFEIKTGSLKPSKASRRAIQRQESKSLDNLLLERRPETQSKINRRFGSSKFYVNKLPLKQDFESALAGCREQEPEATNHVRKSQMFAGLCDYLDSRELKWREEREVQVTSVTCCGFLTKRGNVRKNWLLRWFKLDLRKNCLAYFEGREEQLPKGVIECGRILKVYAEENVEKANRHKFYAVTDDRTFVFKACSNAVMNIWIAVLSLKSSNVSIR